MHLWHLHGHQFYVVGFGFGTFGEETDPESYNLVNPVRRDTVAVLPLGWTALMVSVISCTFNACSFIFTHPCSTESTVCIFGTHSSKQIMLGHGLFIVHSLLMQW